ncbi:MAG TPA: hypothetical protein VIW67_22260 [Terriglobales bacterium]
MEAAAEICDNTRHFADSPTYDLVHQPNSESLFDAFDAGEAVGIRRAWRQRANRSSNELKGIAHEAIEFGLRPEPASAGPNKTDAHWARRR